MIDVLKIESVNKLIKRKIQEKAISIFKKPAMEPITFSSLPVSPSKIMNQSTNKFQMKLGKENIEKQRSSDDSFHQNNIKRLIRKSYQQFKDQKTIIKELYSNLKYQVEPQRQKLLNQLIQNEKDLSSLKQMAKKYQFKTIELKSMFNKLKVEKDKQQKLLSELIDKNLQSFAQIEQNRLRKYTIQKNIQQLKEQNQSKTIQIAQKQQKYRIDRQKFYLQLNHLNFSIEYKQSDKYSVQNDLQVQTIKNFTQNASIHSQELRNCLSFRFQHLIKLKQSKNQKQAQLTLLDQQNAMLQEKILALELDLKSSEQKKKESIDETAHDQFRLNSVEMQNIELKARLQILQHSLSDQINQSKQKKKMILNQQKLIDDAQVSSIHTSSCLSKLIALKLQSEYLQTRIKYSLQK